MRRFRGLLHLYLGGKSAALSAPEGSWTVDLSDGTRRYTVACRGGSRAELRVTELDGSEEPAAEEALAELLEGAGYEVVRSELPFDGIEFKDHSDLQEGIDLLQ